MSVAGTINTPPPVKLIVFKYGAKKVLAQRPETYEDAEAFLLDQFKLKLACNQTITMMLESNTLSTNVVQLPLLANWGKVSEHHDVPVVVVDIYTRRIVRPTRDISPEM